MRGAASSASLGSVSIRCTSRGRCSPVFFRVDVERLGTPRSRMLGFVLDEDRLSLHEVG